MRSIIQTITADHHLNKRQSAADPARWPRIWAPLSTENTPNTGTMKEKTHAEETRPTRDESDREHDSRNG